MKKIQAHLIGETIFSNSSEAFSLHKKSHFGEPSGEKVIYSLSEALFLIEENKLEVLSQKKILSFDELMRKSRRFDKKIQIKYPVFKNLRKKGNIVKTALKFGADFRVYEKGTGPGKKHAKWIVFVDHESKRTSWQDFSAKNRVAHSTKKKLLIAIVDNENDVSYYEIKWLKF
ncbi:MAG: tRNA-intron lyase [Candidatus Pacearchaeota archaeon]